MSLQITQQLKATGIAQVIVVLKSPAAAAEATRSAVRGATRSGAFALTAAAPASPFAGLERYFTQSDLSINSQIADAGLANPVRLGLTSGITRSPRKSEPPPPVHVYPNLGIMLGTVTREGLAGLRSDDRVATVAGAPQFNLIKPMRVAAATLKTDITWGIKALGVTELWKQGLTGKGVRVAHLDTGADGTHPALRTAIVSFAELDAFGRVVKPSPAAHDTGEHGTHTAATIAGRQVQGRSVGVAPNAEIASAIVIEGGNVIARLLGGMDWALTQGVTVLSMSLGLPGFLEDFVPVTRILRTRNVLPVIAAGNEGAGRTRSPGNYAEALSVGAVNEQFIVAPFSSSQRFARKSDPIVPDVVAPGVDVISAKPGGGFQSMDGTSMATPHVAGLAALLFEAKKGATIDEVERAIFASCKPGPGMTQDRGNRGVPDAVKALQLLTGVGPSPVKGAKKAPAKTTKKSAAKPTKKSAAKVTKKSAAKVTKKATRTGKVSRKAAKS